MIVEDGIDVDDGTTNAVVDVDEGKHEPTKQVPTTVTRTPRPNMNSQHISDHTAKVLKLTHCDKCHLSELCPLYELSGHCRVELNIKRSMWRNWKAVGGLSPEDALMTMAETLEKTKMLVRKKPSPKNFEILFKMQRDVFEMKYGKRYHVAHTDESKSGSPTMDIKDLMKDMRNEPQPIDAEFHEATELVGSDAPKTGLKDDLESANSDNYVGKKKKPHEPTDSSGDAAPENEEEGEEDTERKEYERDEEE